MPTPFTRSARKFARQSIRQVHMAKTVVDVLLVLDLHFLQMALQNRSEIYWQHRNAIFSTFTFANGDSGVTEIDVFTP